MLTGGSRGIGRAFAQVALRSGARLTVCARSSEPLKILERDGAVTRALDVTDSAAVADWVQAGVSAHGPIDVVVNNAALLGPKSRLEDYPLDAWRSVMDVNVDGPFIVTQAALPHLVKQGGLFITFTSYLGRHAIERFGAYCASKFAVEGLVRLIHEEHSGRGVMSIAVDPGRVQSEMLKAAAETDDVSEHNTAHAAGEALLSLIQNMTPEKSGTTIGLFNQEL